MAHLSFVIGLGRLHESWEQIPTRTDLEQIYSDFLSLWFAQRDHMTFGVDLLPIDSKSAPDPLSILSLSLT